MLDKLQPEAPEKVEEFPRPNLRKLRDLLAGPLGIRSLSLTGLFVLASFYTLYLGRDFFLPIVLALLLNFLLGPLVRGMKRLYVPEKIGAAVVVLGLLGAFGLGGYELSGPAYAWMERAPQSLRTIERKLRDFKKPVQTIGKATEQVERMAKVGGGPETPAVQVQTTTLGQRMFSQATSLAASGAVMFVLLYFLLASGDLFLRKLIRVLPSLDDKKRAVEIARQIETETSVYLTTITGINILLGVAVGLVMSLVGLPNPVLWGVLAALTNYIPYLGPMTMYIMLAMAGLLTFEDVGRALLAPGGFLCCNVLEAYILTPLVLGRRLTLNPVVIFLGLTFWGWIWGITGALLAVPIMVVFKIFCDHSESLAPIGEFLGS
jgi:predicted PurR-regulated permease PerM